MTTVYAVFGPNGCIGRCDAKCHNAVQPECKCVCGGAHHGIGTAAAVEDRANLTDDELIVEAERIFGPDNYRIVRMTEQMELFI